MGWARYYKLKIVVPSVPPTSVFARLKAYYALVLFQWGLYLFKPCQVQSCLCQNFIILVEQLYAVETAHLLLVVDIHFPDDSADWYFHFLHHVAPCRTGARPITKYKIEAPVALICNHNAA